MAQDGGAEVPGQCLSHLISITNRTLSSATYGLFPEGPRVQGLGQQHERASYMWLEGGPNVYYAWAQKEAGDSRRGMKVGQHRE